ncbi:MAG: MFS transporter [Burkholderiaceae bacterium]|nr:MFS transporter [Burkholderiaceae bacterium]
MSQRAIRNQVSTFLRDATQIDPVDPATAGLPGSYALVGVMVGALLAGSVGDILGRRKVMLASNAWFSVGMALTAMATTTTAFGWLRCWPSSRSSGSAPAAPPDTDLRLAAAPAPAMRHAA